MKASLTTLKFGFWNVENILSRKVPKLDDECFLSYINDNDITGLAETQTKDKFEIPGLYIHMQRTKKIETS